MASRRAPAEFWFLSNGSDPALELLVSAASDISVERRPWPSRRETSGPRAVLCRHPAPEPLTALKRRLSGSKIVVVASPTSDRDDIRAALSQGADAVLLESDIPDGLGATLQALEAGLVVVSSALGPGIERPPLTPREKQVLALVVIGFSNREIADQLVIAESTVKSHLFSAFRRLGVRTRSEAVSLITDPDRGLGSGILSIPKQ